jgi:diguanylate cyclase (GGDEF)-like protein
MTYAPSDLDVFRILLDATRAMLWIRTAEDARKTATSVVAALGGTLDASNVTDSDTLPVDLSFGVGEAMMPSARPGTRARLLLEEHLPSLVLDMRRAVELGSEASRLADDASIDSLTRLPNRRMLGRSLSRLQTDDVVIMADLDHFKRVNDTFGHQKGDDVLRAFGRLLLTMVRGRDTVGRFGGEEFVVILGNGTDPYQFLDRLRKAWEFERPLPVTFSAGVASVADHAATALSAADRAMYRAKNSGRNLWMTATAEDFATLQPMPGSALMGQGSTEFVGFTEFDLARDVTASVEADCAERLKGPVGWPGFGSVQLWVDEHDPDAMVMVSWWKTGESYRAFMRSVDIGQHSLPGSATRQTDDAELRQFRVVAQ